MNRRKMMSALLSIPVIGMLFKRAAKAELVPHNPEQKHSVFGECRALQAKVLQFYSEDFWKECHWKCGPAFRCSLFDEVASSATITTFAEGMAGTLKSEMELLGLPVIVESRKDTFAPNNCAELFHGADLLGFVMSAPIGDFANCFDHPRGIHHQFVIPNMMPPAGCRWRIKWVADAGKYGTPNAG